MRRFTPLTCLLLPLAASAAGTSVSVNGNAIALQAPRDMVWADFLGINTDFADLTNPLIYAPPYLRSMDAVNRQLDALQALGLNWVRDPLRWTLVLNRGDYSVVDANVQPIYTALKARGIHVDYEVVGAPCWAEGGLVSGCPALTGTMKPGMPDTIPPMTALDDLGAFYRHIASTMPQADVLEVWNEQNISNFWQRRSALVPAGSYTAKTLAADYLKLYDTARSNAGSLPLSAGGFAYFSGLDCSAASLPSGCSSWKFFSGYPKDIKYCYDRNGNPQSACSYPDAASSYPENNVSKYGYHLLNGLARSWSSAAPPIAQIHPYVDFQPGQAGATERYLIGATTHLTAQLRGQEGVHNNSNQRDRSASAFTWIDVPQVWAGEFGVSAQTYATGSACSSAADKASCGEALQATYGIRYIALMSAMDFDRVLYFDLADFPDPNYLQNGNTGNRDAHYGLLRDGETPTPKPLYYALQRFLQLTGPSLKRPAADSYTLDAGTLPLFSLRWDKPDGHHLLIYWAPDQIGKTIALRNFPASSATLHQVLSASDSSVTASGGTLTLPAGDAVQILEW